MKKVFLVWIQFATHVLEFEYDPRQFIFRYWPGIACAAWIAPCGQLIVVTCRMP